MKSTYSITEAQAGLPGLVKEAQQSPVTITRHEKAVAYVVSKDRMDAIAETLEILANPEAMQALQASRDGKIDYLPLSDLDED